MPVTLKENIKVLIAEHSAVLRQILSQNLNHNPAIEVIGTAHDINVACDKIIGLKPDVLVLDLEMLQRDSTAFLRKLMMEHPMPVVAIYPQTPYGKKTAMEALIAGAVEISSKPDIVGGTEESCALLIEKIKAASGVRLCKQAPVQYKIRTDPKFPHMPATTNKIFAIGASTGGTRALLILLAALPPNAPGTLVVQHMPAHFTCLFAERLDEHCQVGVKEARDGDLVLPGQVLLAPGGLHMILQHSGSNLYVIVEDGPPVCRQKPSVEVLFNSVAKHAGADAVGVLLTGMGDDGADGLLNMRKSGAHTITQDEESCVVFGMPKEAIERGAAEKVVPLSEIAQTLINFVQ
ncbi:MAG: protein-glutamate methylesterase/protein-glutamine glutaminase [Planctomycetota bacterium]